MRQFNILVISLCACLTLSASAQVTKEQCDAMQKAYMDPKSTNTVCVVGPVDPSLYIHQPKPLTIAICFDWKGYDAIDQGREQSCNSDDNKNTEAEWTDILTNAAKYWRNSCSAADQSQISIDVVLYKTGTDCQTPTQGTRLIVISPIADREQWINRNGKTGVVRTIASTRFIGMQPDGTPAYSQIDMNFTPDHLTNGGGYDKGVRWSRKCCDPTIPQNGCYACCNWTGTNEQLIQCLSYGDIILHELGHALGLGHTKDCNQGTGADVMYGPYCKTKPLSDRDACSLCSMYCERCCNECPPPTSISNLSIGRNGPLPELYIYPNPTRNRIDITYKHLQEACTLELYSGNGDLVKTIHLTPESSTIQTIALDENVFKPGVMFAILKNKDAFTTRKIILIK